MKFKKVASGIIYNLLERLVLHICYTPVRLIDRWSSAISHTIAIVSKNLYELPIYMHVPLVRMRQENEWTDLYFQSFQREMTTHRY